MSTANTTIASIIARLPPPGVFVAAFLLGQKLDGLIPVPLRWLEVAPALPVAGWALVAVGGTTAALCVLLFARSRTTIVPHRGARTLVVGGPFHLTRNPMYVSLTALYLGATLLSASVWAAVLRPVPLMILQRWVIPMEEHSLATAFGSDYQAYRQRVRRWL